MSQHHDMNTIEAWRASLRERQSKNSGSCIAYLGPSRCGKSHEVSAVAIRSAMAVGGMALFYDPTGDMYGYVEGYKLDTCRKIDAGLNREHYTRQLDFLRSNVHVYRGRDAHDLFDHVEDVIGDGTGHSEPFGSVVIDESMIARGESGFLETIAPRCGNGGIILYVTSHRWMGLPPALRSIVRGRFMWRGADSTGDSELERLMDKQPFMSDAVRSRIEELLGETERSEDVELRRLMKGDKFKFSPVMSRTAPEDQWYSGIFYGDEGVEYRSYNPNVARRPDWVLLPSLVSAPVARNLV